MKQWYALRSKPKKEASVATLLSKADIDVYLPQVAVRQRPGKPMVLAPFFPGYLFGQLDAELDQIRLAQYTSGILHVVGYGGQPWPLPDGLIPALQQRLVAFQATTDFRPGDRVAITAGPFREVEAIFDRHLSGAGRARVLIQMLHRLCRVEVHLDRLRRIQAAGVALP